MPSPLSPAALVMPAVALTLLLTTAVAALPALLASGQAPRTPTAAGAPGATEATPPLLLARSGRGVWFLRGQPIAAAALARLLADGPAAGQPGGGEVVLLAGADLRLAEVSASLQWLRRHSRRPVRLEPAL